MKNTFKKTKKGFLITGDLKIVLDNAKKNLEKLKKDLIFETQLFNIFKKRYDNIKNNINKHINFIACAENELRKQQENNKEQD